MDILHQLNGYQIDVKDRSHARKVINYNSSEFWDYLLHDETT